MVIDVGESKVFERQRPRGGAWRRPTKGAPALSLPEFFEFGLQSWPIGNDNAESITACAVPYSILADDWAYSEDR